MTACASPHRRTTVAGPYPQRLVPRVQPTNTHCPVCGVSIETGPLPPDSGPYGWLRTTCQIGTLDNPYIVHGECLGPMNYYHWARIQAYQKWKAMQS